MDAQLNELERALEDGLKAPHFIPNPVSFGNWYCIKPLGTGYDAERRKKKPAVRQDFLQAGQTIK